MKVDRPSDLALRTARRPAPVNELRDVAAAASGMTARNRAEDLVKPRDGLCAFDAHGMNEVEGRS